MDVPVDRSAKGYRLGSTLSKAQFANREPLYWDNARNACAAPRSPSFRRPFGLRKLTAMTSTEQPLQSPINTACPRSGKPVMDTSLTSYRGYVVGFCNTHCRDDFAANVDQCPDDRAFFDELIRTKEKP